MAWKENVPGFIGLTAALVLMIGAAYGMPLILGIIGWVMVMIVALLAQFYSGVVQTLQRELSRARKEDARLFDDLVNRNKDQRIVIEGLLLEREALMVHIQRKESGVQPN